MQYESHHSFNKEGEEQGVFGCSTKLALKLIAADEQHFLFWRQFQKFCTVHSKKCFKVLFSLCTLIWIWIQFHYITGVNSVRDSEAYRSSICLFLRFKVSVVREGSKQKTLIITYQCHLRFKKSFHLSGKCFLLSFFFCLHDCVSSQLVSHL